MKEYRLPILNKKGETIAHTLVDEVDFWSLRRITLHLDGEGYVLFYQRLRVKPYKYRAMKIHNVIMAPPSDRVVDHKFGDKLDNRRKSLRVVTQTENSRNRKANSTKKVQARTGVQFFEKQSVWQAKIYFGKKNVFLGNWKTKELAEAARIGAERVLWDNMAPSKGAQR